jgi:hypothetical protein
LIIDQQGPADTVPKEPAADHDRNRVPVRAWSFKCHASRGETMIPAPGYGTSHWQPMPWASPASP